MQKSNKNGLTSDKLVLKGITNVAKKSLTFEDYMSCLVNQISIKVSDYRIQSTKQKVTSNFVRKIALASFCDKRYILECGIHTRPYSYDTENICHATECNP